MCLAGGVALNCVANGVLVKEELFDDIWIQPAAGDAGGCLGAAFSIWHQHLNNPRKANPSDSMQGAFLGPSFENEEIENELHACNAKFVFLSDEELLELVTDELADGKAIGWMQGRMEFGPRALGNRSILGDPRSENMQKQLNLKVKFRESFRPFAPSILREKLTDWFDLKSPSPYMLIVAKLNNNKRVKSKKNQKQLFGIELLNSKRSVVPAITHVDNSARIQTVDKKVHPKYHSLIKRFEQKTNCPILVNTSFNVRGEPIVCTPSDAMRCFMGTDLDCLVIGNFFLRKEDQDRGLSKMYVDEYELD